MTASQAYYEFLRRLRQECEDELQFHMRKSNRSLCPRRRDFNVLYAKFCIEKFGERNGAGMFDMLEENINLIREKGVKIDHMIYDKENQSSLIIVIVTQLMERVHSKVSINIEYFKIL